MNISVKKIIRNVTSSIIAIVTMFSIILTMGIVFFKTTDGTEFEKECNSELEAQMIFAKLKKKLCTDEELNEILWKNGWKSMEYLLI